MRDALADAYGGPWLVLFLERRLEVPRYGEVAGMGVGFEDVGNSVAMFRYLCENIVGGGSAQGAGGWIKIEDGADDNSLFSLKAATTRCQVLEDCLDFGFVEACLQRLLLVWLLQHPTVIDKGPKSPVQGKCPIKSSSEFSKDLNGLRGIVSNLLACIFERPEITNHAVGRRLKVESRRQ